MEEREKENEREIEERMLREKIEMDERLEIEK